MEWLRKEDIFCSPTAILFLERVSASEMTISKLSDPKRNAHFVHWLAYSAADLASPLDHFG